MLRAPKQRVQKEKPSDLLMVSILNQLLSVLQFSYEIVLRGNIKQISTSKELKYPINPLQKQMICFLSYFTTLETVPNTVSIFSKSFPPFIFLITSEVRGQQEKGEEET